MKQAQGIFFERWPLGVHFKVEPDDGGFHFSVLNDDGRKSARGSSDATGEAVEYPCLEGTAEDYSVAVRRYRDVPRLPIRRGELVGVRSGLLGREDTVLAPVPATASPLKLIGRVPP